MTETQERILRDLEEAYNESRNAPGVYFLVILEKSELRSQQTTTMTTSSSRIRITRGTTRSKRVTSQRVGRILENR